MNTAWLKARPVMFGYVITFLILTVVLLGLVVVDDRTILGEPLWLKPFKFSISIAIYILTIMWFSQDLPRSGVLSLLLFSICAAMLVEQAAITLQAARETTSHYNLRTPLDGAIYGLMGMGVIVNTLACTGFLVLHIWRVQARGSAYQWGVRLGLLVFVLGSLEGYLMIAQGAHTVGGPDGGPGIPVLRWSTDHGDLRIAHFLGIHALQLLPFAGWWIDRKFRRPLRRMVGITTFALIYTGVTGLCVQLALAHAA